MNNRLTEFEDALNGFEDALELRNTGMPSPKANRDAVIAEFSKLESSLEWEAAVNKAQGESIKRVIGQRSALVELLDQAMLIMVAIGRLETELSPETKETIRQWFERKTKLLREFG